MQSVLPLPAVSPAHALVPSEEGLPGQLQTIGLPARVGSGLLALPRRTRGSRSLWAPGIWFPLWVFHMAATQRHSASCLPGLRHRGRKLHKRLPWPPSAQMAYGWCSSLSWFGFRLWSRLLSSAHETMGYVCVCTCTRAYKREPPENGRGPSQQPEKAELDRIRIKPELLGHLNLHAATQLSEDAQRTACIRGRVREGHRQ